MAIALPLRALARHDDWRGRRASGWLWDIAVALCLAGIDVYGSVAEAHPPPGTNGSLVIDTHPSVLSYSLVGLAALVLAARHLWPLPVLVLSASLTAAFAAQGYVDGAALVAVMVALFTVASAESRRLAIAAAALTFLVLGLTEATAPTGWVGGPNFALPFEVAAAAFAGFFVQSRRAYVDEIRDRALRAERSTEEEARRRVDAERLRIARELHDVVAHTMSTINVQAAVASHVLDKDPEEARKALGSIRQASREGLSELRAILQLLRSAEEEGVASPAPGLAQLPALLEATQRAGVGAELSAEGDVRPLPPAVELAAYRIVQESLTNVVRHGGGAPARVKLVYRRDSLTVGIYNEGGPVPIPPLDPGTGNGIAGMMERAAAFGGDLEAGPRPSGGFRVVARLPLQSADQSPT